MTLQTYSVKDFCQSFGISIPLFYKLLKGGTAPKIMKVGRRTLITSEAAEDWKKKMMEKPIDFPA